MGDPASATATALIVSSLIAAGTETAVALTAKSPVPNAPPPPDTPTSPVTATDNVAASVPGAQAAAATQGGTLLGTPTTENQSDQSNAPRKSLLGQ